MSRRDHDRHDSGRFRRLLALAAAILAAVAVVKELRTPKAERTWNGKVAGFVPYDFRRPTVERVKSRLWNPDGGLVGPRVFGVGWAVNLGRAVSLVRRRSEEHQ